MHAWVFVEKTHAFTCQFWYLFVNRCERWKIKKFPQPAGVVPRDYEGRSTSKLNLNEKNVTLQLKKCRAFRLNVCSTSHRTSRAVCHRDVIPFTWRPRWRHASRRDLAIIARFDCCLKPRLLMSSAAGGARNIDIAIQSGPNKTAPLKFAA